jgi:hypothetical protein
MDLTFAEAAGKTFLWLLILRISPLPTKYVFIGAMCNGAKYYRVSSNKINQNPIVELRNNQAQKLITFGMPNVARWTFDHGEDYGWFKSPACSCVSITLPASS